MAVRICTICARSGSKSLPDKNVALLRGRALLSYSVEQAVDTGLFDRIAVSSDAQSYLDVGRSAGATDLIMRPADLASDEASKLDVLRHCLAEVEQATASNFDTLVDLQVTSPFRTKRDIIAAVQLLENDSVAQNVVSATLSKKSPYFTVFENNEEGFAGVCKNLGGAIVRRQDVPKTYDLNGSIYVWRRDTILRASQVTQDRTRIFEMSEHQSLDIDTPLDLFIARQVADLFDWETGELKI